MELCGLPSQAWGDEQELKRNSTAVVGGGTDFFSILQKRLSKPHKYEYNMHIASWKNKTGSTQLNVVSCPTFMSQRFIGT